MANRFPKLTKAILMGALLAVPVACSNDNKPAETEKFPPSVASTDTAKTNTAANMPLPVAKPAPVIAEPIEPAAPVLPDSYKQLMASGKSMLKAGDHKLALMHFEKAHEMRGKAVSPLIQIARALIPMGEFDKARGFAEKAVDKLPESSFAWNTLGRVELASGELEAAVVAFEEAALHDENNSYAWNNLGFVLIELSRHEEAVEALEAATSGENPKHYMWNNLGMSYEHLDMLDEARAAYRTASELGNGKAKANLDRLVGVDTIKLPAEPVEDGDEPLEVSPDKLSGGDVVDAGEAETTETETELDAETEDEVEID